jgi:hypothetical protein
MRRSRTAFVAGLALAGLALFTPPAAAQQASITLLNCSNALCNANDTAWTLEKTPDLQAITGDNTITWTVTATEGATTDNFITVNGFITVKNTGSAPATIGNIVVNLQRPRTGPNTGACRNVPWVSAAADVGNATLDDAATVANIVAGASTDVAACDAAQGVSNYVVSGAKGTFTETAGSGSLSFTLGDNTVFSLTPEYSLAPNASIDLVYTATFDNTLLGLAVGANVRSEVIVTFGNSGARGGSGSSASNIDIDGDGSVNTTDEKLVRSVPCRVTSAIPTLLNGNSTVTLTDTSGDVTVSPVDGGVALGTFSTDIGGGDGDEDITATTERSVSVEQVCTTSGAATVINEAHLDGASANVTVQGSQIGTDPISGLPIYAQYTFTCVAGVALDDGANAEVGCEDDPPTIPNACTYTQGGYHGTGTPGDLFDANYTAVFAGGLTMGIEDGSGPKHDASWSGDATGETALKSYFTGGGSSGALTADTLNATSVSGGTLAKQTATLTLNVGFGITNTVFPTTPAIPAADTSGFGNFTLCNLAEGSAINAFTLTAAQAAALNGLTVSQVLAAANDALGGNGLPSYVASFGNLNELVTALNESFDNCTASAFAVANVCQP